MYWEWRFFVAEVCIQYDNTVYISKFILSQAVDNFSCVHVLKFMDIFSSLSDDSSGDLLLRRLVSWKSTQIIFAEKGRTFRTKFRTKERSFVQEYTKPIISGKHCMSYSYCIRLCVSCIYPHDEYSLWWYSSRITPVVYWITTGTANGPHVGCTCLLVIC